MMLMLLDIMKDMTVGLKMRQNSNRQVKDCEVVNNA